MPLGDQGFLAVPAVETNVPTYRSARLCTGKHSKSHWALAEFFKLQLQLQPIHNVNKSLVKNGH